MHVGEMRNVYNIVVTISEGMRLFQKSGYMLNDNIIFIIER
jgi:hypothetical protein